jgi:hypothetical protein
MKHYFLLFVLCLSMFLVAQPVFSRGPGSMEGRGGKRMVPYQKATFTTIEGSIESVDTIYNRVTSEKGLHLTLKTSKGKYIVHVCPQWYADQQQLSFNTGEIITVSGSRFKKDNNENIYAAVIKRSNGKILMLRNPDTGKHLWGQRYFKERHDQISQEMEENMQEKMQGEMQGKMQGEMREKMQKEMREKKQKEMREKMQKEMRGRGRHH